MEDLERREGTMGEYVVIKPFEVRSRNINTYFIK